jgi:hypothetical protein
MKQLTWYYNTRIKGTHISNMKDEESFINLVSPIPKESGYYCYFITDGKSFIIHT